MQAMPGAPPILQQTRDETVVVSPWFQVPVVFEHSKHVVDWHGMIGHRPGREVLVLPIRRCAVSNVWVPFCTRAVSTSSSPSRSKKRSPSTQFDPAFFNPAITYPNESVAINNVCKQFCCQATRGRANRR